MIYVEVILGDSSGGGEEKLEVVGGAAHGAGEEQGRAVGHAAQSVGSSGRRRASSELPPPAPGLLGCLSTGSASHG